LPPRYLRKVAGHGPAGKHGRDGALRNLFPANLPSTRHPNLVSLPGSELAGQQVNRCELCVHAVSRPESLQIRVGQCPIDTAASDRQQPGDHADRRAGPDSAPASVGPGSVVVEMSRPVRADWSSAMLAASPRWSSAESALPTAMSRWMRSVAASSSSPATSMGVPSHVAAQLLARPA
jgi:hypothetical protein